MLKRIQIKNFRSCKDVVLDNLGGMTALVGRNGSGKTNILRAIEMLARTATSTGIGPISSGFLLPSGATATADIACEGALYRYTLNHALNRAMAEEEEPAIFLQEALAYLGPQDKWQPVIDRRGEEVRLVGRDEPISLGSFAPCLPALAALLPATHPLHRHVQPVLAFFRKARYYPFDETSEVTGFDSYHLISADEYRHWAFPYRSTGQTEDSVLMRLLYAHNESPEQFEEIQSLLGPKGRRLIERIVVNRTHLGGEHERRSPPTNPSNYYHVEFRLGRLLGGGPTLLLYPQLSLGTRRILHLIVSLILDGSALLLIEHPEDGIHRGLVRKLIDLLRANVDPAQVILSSHSAVVLNELPAQDVRLLSIHRGATRVRALGAKEVASAARFIEDAGTMAEFLETVEE